MVKLSCERVKRYDKIAFMDIYWYGQACFKLKGKNVSLLIDPYDPEITGLKLPKDVESDATLVTHEHEDHNFTKAAPNTPVIINGPGDYDIKGSAITGIASFHDKNGGQDRGKNIIYNINIDGLNIVHLGDLGHVLTQSQIEELGSVDILLVPVGGVYTIEADDASQVVSQLEPKVVIPMHYKIDGLKFELTDAKAFLKEMGAENVEPAAKFSTTKDKLPEETQVVVLSKV